MYRGVIVAIVAIIGISMIGTGYLSGNDNDNDRGWFNKFWNSDNNWFKKSWDDFNFKKFTGFMSSGGSNNNNDDKCDCEDRKKDHKEHYDDFDRYYKDNKKKFEKKDYSKFMKDYENYMQREGKHMDKSDYKMFMDYHEKFLKDNKNSFSSRDYKHSSDEHKKYSKDYPKHDDQCKCVPDRDDDEPMIDHAIISFNINQIPLKDNNGEQTHFQNIVDECIFETAVDFAPLCIKCVFLNSQNTIVAKGEIIELDQSYTANTEIPIQMSSVPWAAPYTPVANDVQDVDKVELTLCGEKCVPVFADFKDLEHGARESLINAAMASQGIKVSGVGNNGPSEVIIFDTDKTGTPDPDLQLNNKHWKLLILPEKNTAIDSDGDDHIDNPNDAAAGGTISIELTTPKYLQSFVIVDHENDLANSKAIAYDSANNQIGAAVTLPDTGNGGFATVFMNKANVKRLDVTYMDSGGITNIDLKCAPPEQNCECEKPDKFIVTYDGPTMDKVVISGNQGSFTINEQITTGFDIVVTGGQLGTPNGKMPPNTTYDFYKNNIKKGTITIHTSCSQTLFIGQMFTTQGTSGQIKLTVKDGTINGKTSIPDQSCPVPPPEEPKCIECQKPTKFTVKYDGPKDDVTVKIFKKISNNAPSELVYAVPGTFDSGENIEIDSTNWGQSKVNPDTVYAFYKYGNLIGYVKIHTSCSQDLFIGDMFFYKQGDLSKQIKLTVVSGFTSGGLPAIPESMCKDSSHDDYDD